MEKLKYVEPKGYLNDEMRKILKRGETKNSSKAGKNTTKSDTKSPAKKSK